MLTRWKQDFINGLRAGKSAETCARLYAGIPLFAVHSERADDKEFAQAWDDAAGNEGEDLRAPVRKLTPGGLEALLWAQVPDKRVAAYFGMDEPELLAAIAYNEELTKVYYTARDAGLAALGRRQFEAALEGDKAMLTWMGKQYLGQSDKIDNRMIGAPDGNTTVNINTIVLRTLTNEQLEMIAAQAQGIDMPVIEQAAERITEAVVVE